MKQSQVAVAVVAAVGIAVVVGLGLVASLARSGLQDSRNVASEAIAIGALRAIIAAQSIYTTSCGNGYYSPSLTNLGVAPDGGTAFLSRDLSVSDTATKSGYVITMGSSSGASEGAPPSCNGLPAGSVVAGYWATATPTEGAGSRAFGTNTSATIYEAEQKIPLRMTDNSAPAGAAERK
mgnify:FL=1